MKSLRAFQLGTVAALAVAACTVSAVAADLPSRVLAPVAPAMPAPMWTGFYLGIDGGADIRNNGFATTSLPGLGLGPIGANTAGLNQTSGRVGLYLGYNYQISNYVLGIEGDAAYDFGGRKTVSGIPGTGVAPSVDSVGASSKYDASVRGRLGYLITPAVLAYATGGVAFRDASYTMNCPATGAASYCTFPEFENFRQTLVGWTVGGGIEGYVAPNWLLRAEYRYSDFGARSHTFFANSPLAGVDAIATRTHLTSSTITAGVAYQFSFDPAPVVARY